MPRGTKMSGTDYLKPSKGGGSYYKAGKTGSSAMGKAAGSSTAKKIANKGRATLAGPGMGKQAISYLSKKGM